MIRVMYDQRWTRWPHTIPLHSFPVPGLPLQLSLLALVLILVIPGLGIIHMQSTTIRCIRLIPNAHPITGEIDRRVHRCLKDKSNVAKVLLGQTQCRYFSASIKHFSDYVLGDILRKATNEHCATAWRTFACRGGRDTGIGWEEGAGGGGDEFLHGQEALWVVVI